MNEKLFIKAVISGVVVLFVAWLFAYFGGSGVHNNGGGAAAVADGIESAKDLNNEAEKQREKAEAGIAGAEKSADRIEASIEQSADITSQLEASIDRCQQTIDRIRQRGKIQTP